MPKVPKITSLQYPSNILRKRQGILLKCNSKFTSILKKAGTAIVCLAVVHVLLVFCLLYTRRIPALGIESFYQTFLITNNLLCSTDVLKYFYC